MLGLVHAWSAEQPRPRGPALGAETAPALLGDGAHLRKKWGKIKKPERIFGFTAFATALVCRVHCAITSGQKAAGGAQPQGVL